MCWFCQVGLVVGKGCQYAGANVQKKFVRVAHNGIDEGRRMG